MIVDIELTRQANEHYVARALQFPEVVVEAVSRKAALTQIREALTARRRAGTFPDDEVYHTMLAEVERQRRNRTDAHTTGKCVTPYGA